MGTATADLPIRIPPGALVLLIGPAGSGKSTFASRHFDASAVISSDRLRGLLAGDEAEQRVTDAAFKRLDRWVDARLEAGTFGTCVRCGKPILLERLEALPWAARCIDCQRIARRDR